MRLIKATDAFLEDVVAGTAAASKAVVLDADGKIDAIDVTALSLNGTEITATAAELNEIGGSEVTTEDLAKLHAVTASADELNVLDGATASADEISLLDDETITAGAGGLTEKRFVSISNTGTFITAPANDLYVIGVAKETVGGTETSAVKKFGICTVEADCPLLARDVIKVGSEGRVTKWNSATVTIKEDVTGTATSFTQPGAGATVVEVVQAGDVEGDRGRSIVIVGGDALGDAITETIALDATNTTTAVAGTTEFTTVSGAYMADGEVLGAQNVTIRIESAGATIATLASGSSAIGVETPTNIQAYCTTVKHTNEANGADVTYLTFVGVDDSDDVALERVVLADGDAGTPAAATSTTKFKQVNYICTGEFTNAAIGNLLTSAADATTLVVGRNTAAVAAENDDAVIFLKPNA